MANVPSPIRSKVSFTGETDRSYRNDTEPTPSTRHSTAFTHSNSFGQKGRRDGTFPERDSPQTSTSMKPSYTDATPKRESPSEDGRYCKAVKELARLQNEVAFLKGVLRTTGGEDSPGPVYLVPSEFFYALKDTIARSFASVEAHVSQLGENSEELAGRYQSLKERAGGFLHSNLQITSDLILEMLDVLAETEDLQKDVAKGYQAEVERINAEMTELLEESFIVMKRVSERNSRSSNPEELSIWTERKTAITKENPSFALVSIKRNLLSDFEHVKQRALGQLLGIADFQSPEKPRSSPFRKTFSYSSLRTPQPSSEELKFSMKRSLADLFEALNRAKSEVGKWSWKESPLKGEFAPRVGQQADVDTALRLARNDVEEVTKVIVAEREVIEARLKAAGVGEDRKVREEQLREELEAVSRELRRQEDRLKADSESRKQEALSKENDLLSAEVSELRHTLKQQNSDVQSTLARVCRSCGLSPDTPIATLESRIASLYRCYLENTELQVMESFESPMALTYQTTKFLTTYGFSESNVSVGMKYLIAKTDAIMAELDESYSATDFEHESNMQNLQRKEYQLLEVIKEEVVRLKAAKYSDAERGQLEQAVDALNGEIQRLNDTVANLQASLALTDLKIEFDIPNIEAFQRPSTRLAAELSVEERLIKGFEMIIEKTRQILQSQDEVPESLLDKQKFLYEKVDLIGEMIASDRNTIGELQGNHAAIAEELQVLKEQFNTLQQQSSLERTELEAKTAEIAEAVAADIEPRWDGIVQRLAELSGKVAAFAQEKAAKDSRESLELASLRDKVAELESEKTAKVSREALELASLRDKVAELESEKTAKVSREALELASLRDKVAELESEKTAILGQLQVAEVAFPEATEDVPTPLGSTITERLSAILDQAIVSTSGTLGKDQELKDSVADKLRALFDNLTEISGSVTRLKDTAANSAAEVERLTTANAAMNQQLSITDVSIQLLAEPPADVIETQEEHAVTETSLGTGFNFSIERVANALGVECSPPENLMEKQRCLYDLILRLCAESESRRRALETWKTAGERSALEWTERAEKLEGEVQRRVGEACERVARITDALKQKGKSALAVRELEVVSLNVDITSWKQPDPGLKLHKQLMKGNEYLIAKAAHALEQLPFCPATLLDQQMCLYDLIKKLADLAVTARERKLQLKDAGSTYRNMYGDKSFLEKLFWL